MRPKLRLVRNKLHKWNCRDSSEFGKLILHWTKIQMQLFSFCSHFSWAEVKDLDFFLMYTKDLILSILFINLCYLFKSVISLRMPVKNLTYFASKTWFSFIMLLCFCQLFTLLLVMSFLKNFTTNVIHCVLNLKPKSLSWMCNISVQFIFRLAPNLLARVEGCIRDISENKLLNYRSFLTNC